jgi:hypothetical protein
MVRISALSALSFTTPTRWATGAIVWCLGQTQQSFLQRLPHPQRVKLLAALLLVIVLGLGLLFLAWWGGRATRRYMNWTRTGKRREPGWREDDWARKPLQTDSDTTEEEPS